MKISVSGPGSFPATKARRLAAWTAIQRTADLPNQGHSSLYIHPLYKALTVTGERPQGIKKTHREPFQPSARWSHSIEDSALGSANDLFHPL